MKFIQAKAPRAKVEFNQGTDVAAAAALAKTSQVAIVFVNQPMSEGSDATTLTLPDKQDDLVNAVVAANPHTIVVLETGGPVTMPWSDKVSGIVSAWYPGIGGGQAIANILFGDVNPSAKLPVSFAKSDADLPHPQAVGPVQTPGGRGGAGGGRGGAAAMTPEQQQAMQVTQAQQQATQALQQATQASQALVDAQQRLVQAQQAAPAAGANPAAATQAAAQAVHAALLALQAAQPPAAAGRGGAGMGMGGGRGTPFDVNYSEKLQVGYKWYDAQNKEPLFPFGYGLSYTTFAYSGLKVTASGHNVTVSFAVRNTGKRAGKEIAQVYASLPAATGEPPKRLIGWQKVQLAPGESKTVNLTIDPLYLSIFNVSSDKFEVAGGEYKILAGGSSRTLPLSEAVKID
jgi:hypothetical protein